MNTKIKNSLKLSAIMLIMLLALTACTSKKETEEFTPRLDTDSKITLNIMGFFGNFEALDSVMNDFNKYYPNVDFSYQQMSGENMKRYIDSNPDTDIFMTSKQVLAESDYCLTPYCADLSKENIDFSAIEDKMLDAYYQDGKLTSIPIGQNIYGIIVNVTLLKNEGLEVPQTYEEFINVLKALKEKGYTPIQSPNEKVLAELGCGMLYDTLLTDSSCYEALMAGNEAAAEKITPVFDKLAAILENGCTDFAVNADYPSDNYDGAILKFFEGDVPFWVCNVEKVSGMKKRETKSETFKSNPFEYAFVYAPMGENGAYAFREPWYGFAVYKYSNNYDYAVEFMRFLALKDEINKIADMKGIPSIAVEKTDNAIYKNVNNPSKTELACVNDGRIIQKIETAWYGSLNMFINGECTKEEAVKAFIKKCSE